MADILTADILIAHTKTIMVFLFYFNALILDSNQDKETALEKDAICGRVKLIIMENMKKVKCCHRVCFDEAVFGEELPQLRWTTQQLIM